MAASTPAPRTIRSNFIRTIISGNEDEAEGENRFSRQDEKYEISSLRRGGAVRRTEFGCFAPPLATPARHGRACPGHPRPDAVVNVKSCLPRRRVDGRDKPGPGVGGGHWAEISLWIHHSSFSPDD